MSRGVTRYLPNGLGSTAFSLLAIAILAGGCNHPSSKNDDDTTGHSLAPELLQTAVGGRITIRGKLVLFKCGLKWGPAIQLDDGEGVCLVEISSKSFEDPYAEMYGKLVEATGTLRLYHNPTPIGETRPSQRVQDHYYFEREITQVRIITN